MIQKAYKLNPFNSEWFAWVDAGICTYRDNPPPDRVFPDETKLVLLPRDQFIYSCSNEYDSHPYKVFNPLNVNKYNYYHYISGTYVIYKTMIDTFVRLYMGYLDELLDSNNLWTDQVVLTHMYKDDPNLFYKLSDVYGGVIENLF